MSHQIQEAAWSEEPRGLASDIHTYAGLVRRRWWILVLAVLVCVGGAWWSQRGRIPTYTAQVLLQQRVETPVVGLATGLGGNVDFGSQAEILRSRAVLAPIVDSLGLRLVLRSHPWLRTTLVESIEFDTDEVRGSYSLVGSDGTWNLIEAATQEQVAEVRAGGILDGPGFQMVVRGLENLAAPLDFSISNRELTLESLIRSVQVEQGGGRDLMRVRYRSADRVLAAAVVNAVALSYQEHRAADAKGSAGRRRSVIASEMEMLADSVRLAQAAVESYQSSAQLLDPNVEGNALMASLLDVENELRRLQFDEALLESLVSGLNSGDTEDESLASIMALGSELVPAGPALDQRLQGLQAERRTLTANRFGATEFSPAVEVLDAQIASTREQMRVTAEQSLSLHRSRIAAAEERVVDLRGQIGTLPTRTSEYTRLQQQSDAVQQVFDRLVGSYYEAQIAEGVEAGDVAVVDPAPVPLFPDPSPIAFNLIIALIGGLIVGGAGVVVTDHLDTRIREKHEAEGATGLQVLGTIPSIGSGLGSSKSRTVGIEAFRGLRTNLQFAALGQPLTVGICSSSPAEGKSTVAVNLAMALVEKGDSVLIVDADLRRSRIHEITGVQRGPGLSEVLAGEVTAAQAIYVSTLHESVHVLPAGESADSSSAGLLEHRSFDELLIELRDRYDRVLVDMPPILAVSEASVVASKVDGNLVVVRANETDRETLEACVQQLRRSNAPILGIILNDARGDAVSYSQYYDTYHQEPNGGRRPWRSRRKALIVAAKS